MVTSGGLLLVCSTLVVDIDTFEVGVAAVVAVIRRGRLRSLNARYLWGLDARGRMDDTEVDDAGAEDVTAIALPTPTLVRASATTPAAAILILFMLCSFG